MIQAILIDIIYALPSTQTVKQIKWHEGITVAEAIQASQIQESHPEMQIADGKVGIYGKAVKLSQALKPTDRIEIYRPLVNDPKEMRRKKAEAEKQAKSS
jgi:putative ubiquitin-RnfH superfamily antitoxin RatB of RatAB toxin-antitoxin module